MPQHFSMLRRNKAINEFHKKTARVMMLSAENSASGTNLTEGMTKTDQQSLIPNFCVLASHVVLIEPIGGTRDEALAVERQAIGRSHRQGQTKSVIVARFVVSNTIEYQLHRRNHALLRPERSASLLKKSASALSPPFKSAGRRASLLKSPESNTNNSSSSSSSSSSSDNNNSSSSSNHNSSSSSSSSSSGLKRRSSTLLLKRH